MAPKRQRVAVVMPLYRGPAALPVGSSSEEKLATMNQRLQDLRDIRLSAQTIAIYRGTFQAYANWCNFFDVPSLPINRLVLLRMIDVKCDDNDNATSAHMWVSQTYSYARFAFGAPLLTTDDALFWHDIYPGLYKEYGKHKFSPPALGAKELLKIYDTTQPDPRKDLPLWINWLHILFAYHATMRPNEHTGKDCEAVVRNVHFLDNNEGLRYHFPATKGTRMAHLSDGENTYVRSDGSRRVHRQCTNEPQKLSYHGFRRLLEDVSSKEVLQPHTVLTSYRPLLMQMLLATARLGHTPAPSHHAKAVCPLHLAYGAQAARFTGLRPWGNAYGIIGCEPYPS